jgi:hypothetical protein
MVPQNPGEPRRATIMGANRRLKRKLLAALVTGLSILTASCNDWPLGPPTSATLAVCPSDQAQSTSSILDALGGTVSLDGTSLVVPLGALRSSTSIELGIPASQYMEISATANGGHFLFLRPITVTIDYSRCSPTVQQQTLSVWNIDPDTKQLLQNMGGVDNKLTHQITFTTLHFSGYALAF